MASASTSASTATAPATQVELLAEATAGFDALLNNDLPSAQSVLSSRPESAFHLVGLGLTAFLAAALGQEDKELYQALAILSRAEVAATARSGMKRAKNEPTTVYPTGSEYKILIADSVVCQALVHVLTESYLEFMKAIYKLNRAYKGFGSIYKIVFPTGVTEDDSLADIYAKINASYLFHSRALIASENSTGFFGWNKKQRMDAPPLRHAASDAMLPEMARLSVTTSATDKNGNAFPVSTPNSRPVSRVPSPVASFSNGTTAMNGERLPKAEWEGDAMATLVISGAAFGFGLFGLIFSLLPPKLRKLISWFGFSNSNRVVALRLLTIAATTGNDVHGYFACLALLTYYGVVLLMSGWQADENMILDQCADVLSRVEQRLPNGTLWILNRAKICRMKHDTTAAIAILEGALEKGSTFREADSLLVFELSWCYLSNGEWLKSANSFLRMKELNAWSHATYVFIAAGALLDLPKSERTPEIEARVQALITELPTLFENKRMMGEPPSTEMFIMRKLNVYKAKHARWIADGRLSAQSKFWEVIRVSPASELGLFWNTNGRAPAAAVQMQIEHLTAFSPPPKFGPTSDVTKLATAAGSALITSPSYLSTTSRRSRLASISSTNSRKSQHAAFDLDTIDEIATRDLLLGGLYRTLGELTIARSFLRAVIDAEDEILDENWVVPFAIFELAVLECKQAEVDGAKAKVEGKEVKEIWRAQLKTADKLLDSIFAHPEFDLKSRLESRSQMLRDELTVKRTQLGM